MPFSIARALLATALSSILFAQQPATADVAALRKEANAALEARDFDVAAAAFRKLTDANSRDGQAWQLLGYSLHAAKKLDEALPAHMKAAEFPRFASVASYNVACVHALKGDADAAFAWLDKAVAAGFVDLDHLRGDTDFDALRKDARMARLEAAVQAKAASSGGAQVFAQSSERKNARAAWFSGKGSPGQIAIDYSPIAWRDEFEGVVTSARMKGRKWRLGADFWTRLDTSLDLQLGAVTVPAGYYYLTLQQRDVDTFVLALHDAAAVKKLKLDASMADKLQGGIEVPMTHRVADESAPNLDITVEMKPGSKTEGSIGVRFGKHALAAPFVVAFE
jgi:tetratricopeptide (TPR) repeat protein